MENEKFESREEELMNELFNRKIEIKLSKRTSDDNISIVDTTYDNIYQFSSYIDSSGKREACFGYRLEMFHDPIGSDLDIILEYFSLLKASRDLYAKPI